LRTVAAALRDQPEIGECALARVCREAFRKFFRPPTYVDLRRSSQRRAAAGLAAPAATAPD
jgi:hypothetical protein